MRDIVSPLSGFGSPFVQRRRDTLASVIASIFRDSDGFTTPLTLDQYFKDLAGEEVSENTDPIALALDPSGNENNLTQTSATFRPTLNAGDILFDGGDDRLVSPYVSGTSGSLFARFNGATASRVLLGAQPATNGRAFLGLDASGRISAGIGEQATGVIRDQEADRRNLLSFTEDFGNAVWIKAAGVTLTNQGGGVWRLQFSAGNNRLAFGYVHPLRVTFAIDVKDNSGGTANTFRQYTHGDSISANKTASSEWVRVVYTNPADIDNATARETGITRALGDLPLDILIRFPQAEQGTETTPYQPIIGATLNDLRNAWHTAGVTWDGTTVKLYLDGAEVYSEPQVGAVSGTTPAMLGALNANGTASAFWNGRVSNALTVNRPLTPAEITKLTNKWSA